MGPQIAGRPEKIEEGVNLGPIVMLREESANTQIITR